MNRYAHYRYICGLFLAWLGMAGAWAQEVPKVIAFDQRPSQAKNQNWAVAQAPDRRIYLANSEGLLRYDGAAWQTFHLPDRQIVRAVATGKEGRVFTGGFGEFGYWQYDPTGQFHYHSLSDSLPEPYRQEEIWHIVVQDEWVWFQSFATLFGWDGERLLIRRPEPATAIMFAFPIGDRLLLQARGRGLLELYPDQRLGLLPGSEALADKEVTAILPAPGGSLLIGTALSGLFRYAGGRVTRWESPLNPAFERSQLNRAVALRDGGYALGTILDGLYVLDAQGQLRFHLNQEKGLQNNTVLALYQDQDGQLWTGLDKGVDLIALNSPLTFYPDVRGRLGTVYAAARYQGRLYLGTNHGLYRQVANEYELVDGSQGQVWELRVVRGELLCGHNEGSFRLVDGRPAWLSEVAGGWVSRLWPGREDLLLQGTYSGLVVYRFEQGKWAFSHRVEGFAESSRYLQLGAGGEVWVAHPYRGLYCLRLSDDLRRVVAQRALGQAEGLPTQAKLSVTQLNDTLWVKAEGRYFRWEAEEKRFVPAHKAWMERLSPEPGTLIPAWAGTLFMATPYGLQVVQNGRSYALPVALVPDYETVIPLDSQTYLLGLDEGYAMLDLARVAAGNPAELAPFISELVWQADSLPVLLAYPATRRAEPWMLRANQRNVRFRFAVPAYTQPVRYRFRLLPFSQSWSPWQREPFKDFSNLASGSYTFEVQSSLGAAVARLPLEVAPPWYFSGWAMGAYGLLLMGMLWLAVRYHHWRLDRHQRRLEIEKQREINRQRMVARNEQLRQDVDNKNRELATSTMNLVRKNEILQQLKEDLQRVRARAGQGFPAEDYQLLLSRIDNHLASEHDWETFETHFNRVHEAFFKQLKVDFPDLTPGDLRLAAYLRMNLASKEIAPLLNISLRGVENKRYRLRKKLGLESEENLVELLMQY